MSEITLSGSEITVLKTLGLTGSVSTGEILAQRANGMEDAELLDTLQGLIDIGYVLPSREGIRTVKEMNSATFKVNSSYARMLLETIDPRKKKPKKKRRIRRE